MKYAIGKHDFKTVRENDYFYADKSALLYKLVKGGQFLWFSISVKSAIFAVK